MFSPWLANVGRGTTQRSGCLALTLVERGGNYINNANGVVHTNINTL